MCVVVDDPVEFSRIITDQAYSKPVMTQIVVLDFKTLRHYNQFPFSQNVF